MSVHRILMSPDDEAGSSPVEEFVMISRAELEELRSRTETEQRVLGEVDAASAAREADHARELSDRERKSAEWERAFRAALRDREVATALVGRPLLPGAASQLLKLWREEFEVYEDGGEFKVVDRLGRPAGKAVDAWLAGPDYAHFCQPSSRGGTAVKGGHRPAADGGTQAPKTLGEAALLRWQEAATKATGRSAPIGLGRRR